MGIELLILGAAFVALGLAAYFFGVDSRDGCDWIAHPDRAPCVAGSQA